MRPTPHYAKLVHRGEDATCSVLDRDPECVNYDTCLTFAYANNLDMGCPETCPAHSVPPKDVDEIAMRRLHEAIATTVSEHGDYPVRGEGADPGYVNALATSRRGFFRRTSTVSCPDCEMLTPARRVKNGKGTAWSVTCSCGYRDDDYRIRESRTAASDIVTRMCSLVEGE